MRLGLLGGGSVGKATRLNAARRTDVPPVRSFICPHCDNMIGMGTRLGSMAVNAPAGEGSIVYVLICPYCSKPLGTYSAPSHSTPSAP